MSLIDNIRRDGRKYKKLDGIYVNGEYYEDILLEETEDRGFRVNIDVSMYYENFQGIMMKTDQKKENGKIYIKKQQMNLIMLV